MSIRGVCFHDVSQVMKKRIKDKKSVKKTQQQQQSNNVL